MEADERRPLLGGAAPISPSTRRKIACVAILVAQGLERVACYSLSGNLIFFLAKKPLCWQSRISTAAELIFTAVMYITGLFGGWISDSYLARYATIIVGYVIYGIGYIYLPVLTYFTRDLYNASQATVEGTSCSPTWMNGSIPPFCSTPVDGASTCSLTIFGALAFIGIGAGVVRTNLGPFGGDQARDEGLALTQTFFIGYYWAINVGALIALVGIAMLQNYSFFYGYIAAYAALVLSLVTFLAGTKFYTRRPAGSINVFKNVFDLISNAYRVRKDNPRLYELVPNFLDYANMEYDGGRFNVHQISDVRRLWKISKVFLLMTPYWICYSQMYLSVFLLQGLHLRMDFDHDMLFCPHPRIQSENYKEEDCRQINVSSKGDNFDEAIFPPASLAVFDTLFIVFSLPMIQRFYRCLSSRNIVKVVRWKRISFGMFLAIFSLIAAGTLEYVRLENILECGVQRQQIGTMVYNASPGVSLLWQIPQYILIGASEVFFIVTGMEYAYMEAPVNMQGIVMGLYWFSVGIGNLIGASLPFLFKYIGGIWKDPVYINCNKFDLLFFILATFLTLFSILFVLIAKRTDLGLDAIILDGQSTRSRSQSTNEPDITQI